jgi:TolB-like protein
MPFTNNSGQKENDWLCTGIAESISTKLGSLPYFSLVERLKLAEAMKEIELGQTGLISESTAAQTGQMAGAEELVIGSFQVVGQTIRINARFLKVEEAKVRTTSESTGKLDQIFEL